MTADVILLILHSLQDWNNFCNLGIYHTKYILSAVFAASFAHCDLHIWNHGNLLKPANIVSLIVLGELVANVFQIFHQSMYSTVFGQLPVSSGGEVLDPDHFLGFSLFVVAKRSTQITSLSDLIRLRIFHTTFGLTDS